MCLTRMRSFMRNESHYGFEFVPAPATAGAGTFLKFLSNQTWKANMSSVLSTQLDDRIASRRADAQVWLSGIRDLIAKVNKHARKFIDEGNRRLDESCDAAEIDAIVDSAERIERIIGAVIVELSPLRTASPLAHRPERLPGQLRLIGQE